MDPTFVEALNDDVNAQDDYHDFHSPPPAPSYRPPHVETDLWESFTTDAPLPPSPQRNGAQHTEQAKIDLINDDEEFYNLVAALLSLHAEGESVERVLLNNLTAVERNEFMVALEHRVQRLPTFPEAGEVRTSALVRSAEQTFYPTLCDLPTRFIPEADYDPTTENFSPASPEETLPGAVGGNPSTHSPLLDQNCLSQDNRKSWKRASDSRRHHYSASLLRSGHQQTAPQYDDHRDMGYEWMPDTMHDRRTRQNNHAEQSHEFMFHHRRFASSPSTMTNSIHKEQDDKNIYDDKHGQRKKADEGPFTPRQHNRVKKVQKHCASNGDEAKNGLGLSINTQRESIEAPPAAPPVQKDMRIRSNDEGQTHHVPLFPPPLINELDKSQDVGSPTAVERDENDSAREEGPQKDRQRAGTESPLNEPELVFEAVENLSLPKHITTETRPNTDPPNNTKTDQGKLPAAGKFKIDILKRKNALAYSEAETVYTQSQLKRRLLDEVNSATQCIDAARDAEERDAYQQYLNELEFELEKWNQHSTFGHGTSPRSAQQEAHRKEKAVRPSPKKKQKRKEKPNNPIELDEIIMKLNQQECQKEEEGTAGSPVHDENIGVRRVVSIAAPETLPEDYKFEARLGDEVFMATVPQGGVQKGQVFETTMGKLHDDEDSVGNFRSSIYMEMQTPRMRWRDGLCDCLDYGCLVPICWNSCFCPQIALTQVMARLHLTAAGTKGVNLRSRVRVRNTIFFTVGLVILHGLFVYPLVEAPSSILVLATAMILLALDISSLVYFCYMTAHTRKNVRMEYDIPEGCCKGCEDVCVSICCNSCTISQMGRHTADYETYRAYCCTDTGLPRHVEVKLPSEYQGS